MTARLRRMINVPGLLVIAGAIALWDVLVVSGTLTYDYLPRPLSVWHELRSLVGSGELLTDVGHTLYVAGVASAIAIVAGAAIGMAIGLIPAVRTYLLASVDVLRTVPTLALMPVALLIWGASGKAETIVAIYGGIWPVIINTADGVGSIHPRLQEVARTFRLSRADTVRKIVLPATTPSILVGARLGVVTALVVAIVAEMLISSQGLGWGLVQSQQALQPARMWAYAVACGIVGYGVNALLVFGVRAALPGGGAGVGLEGTR